MVLTLKLLSGDLEPPPELSFDAPRVVVGRASGCELSLPDPSVSPRHASFRQRGSGYVLVDESSDNGTFSGRSRLARQTPYTLSDGELVRFGRVWVEVRLLPGGVPSEPSASRELARALVEHALRQEGRPCGMSVRLESAGSPEQTLSIRQDRKPYVVGTQKSAHLKLADADLPGRALELRRQGGELWVTSCEASLPLKLAGRDLARGERTLWPRGAELVLGSYRLTHSDPTAETLERIEHGKTERLDPREIMDPPGGSSATATEHAEDASAAEELAPQTRAAAERRSNPPRVAGKLRQPPRKRAADTAWTRADAAILLLAVSVLGLSLWAIQWIAGLGPA